MGSYAGNAFFHLRILERWLILESQQELSLPADEDRVFVLSTTNEPNKASGHFVVVDAEFRGPCTCFTTTARGNTDTIVSRKREVVSAFQLCEHTGADMNG